MKFKYKNDEITINLRAWLLWKFWRASTPGQKCYYSTVYEFGFDDFRDYWYEVGNRSALVQFISSRSPGKYGPKYYSEEEVVQRLARLDLGDSSGIVLSNLNDVEIPDLMMMFPGVAQNVFVRGDYIVFPTQNKEAAIKLAHSIPLHMADVTAFADGYIYGNNKNVE